nr:hypothetical protein [Tanacetum cinerariifolium]
HVTLTPVNPDGQQHSSSMSSQFVTSMFNLSPDVGIDSLFESTHRVDVPVSTTFIPLLVTAPTLPPPSIPIMSQFAKAVSSIPRIVGRHIDHRMNEAVKVAVQLQSDRLRDEAQAENEDFINKLDKNIQKIIKEQVKTSYVVAANLSELELKKILIEKMESNKSINRSDEQRNLYKALVDAYECDKIILDTYGDTVTLNRRRDDADKDEEPSAGSDRGSKRKREGKEPESTSAPKEKASNTTDTLTPKLLAGPTYELMKGSCKSPVELEFFLEEVYKATTDQLDWINPEGQFVVNKESAQDVYSKRRIIVVTELQIVEWHDYKHLDWITVRRDDDKLYKFKKGDFKRLRIQDIENMLLLLVQGKLTNLTIEERFAFNVSLRMFTRSIVIQRRVKDLQLGVESYQKKLNLTKPDTYMTDFNCKEAYIAYSNLRGFIYQNKDKQIRLIRIDEVHKFSDGTLNDVRTTLDDRLKGIQ